MFELSLSKTPTKEAPPTLKLWRAGTPATARFARQPQRKMFLAFRICAPPIFSSKRKTKLFFGVLLSTSRWRDWPHFDLAREKRNSPPQPFLFARPSVQFGARSAPSVPFKK